MKNLKKLSYTTTGIIKKGKGFARNWEDVYELLNKTTHRQKVTFKNKYENVIKKVTYETKNVHGEIRRNVFMVASQEVVGNKTISDYQMKAFVNENANVRTNAQRFRFRVTRAMKLALKSINESLNYNFGCTLKPEGVIDNKTNEIVLSKEKLYSIMKVVSNETKNSEEILLNTATKLYEILKKKTIIVSIDEFGGRFMETKENKNIELNNETKVTEETDLTKAFKEGKTVVDVRIVNPVVELEELKEFYEYDKSLPEHSIKVFMIKRKDLPQYKKDKGWTEDEYRKRLKTLQRCFLSKDILLNRE